MDENSRQLFVKTVNISLCGSKFRRNFADFCGLNIHTTRVSGFLQILTALKSGRKT